MDSDICPRLLFDYLTAFNMVSVSMCVDKEFDLIWASTQFFQKGEQAIDWRCFETGIYQTNLLLSKDNGDSNEAALTMGVLDDLEIISDLLSLFHFYSQERVLTNLDKDNS